MSKQVFICPVCRTQYDFEPDYLGHRIQCDNCESKFFADYNVSTVNEAGESVAASPAAGFSPSAAASVAITPVTEDEVAAAETEMEDSAPDSQEFDGRVAAKCPKCSYSARVPLALAGRQLKCPQCQWIFRVEGLGGFEVVGGAAAAMPSAPAKPVTVEFAKDLAQPYSVTVTYRERVMVKIGQKMTPRIKEKSFVSHLGETVSFSISRPTKFVFRIGRLNAGGEFEAVPGRRYVIRRKGGFSWMAEEILDFE